MASIMYGLKRPTVLIWTGAWEVVPQKYMDLFRELDVIMNERNGFEGYWNAVHAIEPPAVPLLAPYMHQLFDTWTNTPLSYDDDDLDLKQKRINFRKFYDMYSIAAELETLRLSSYNSILKGNRETNNLLVNHIRLFTTGNALGTGTLFSTGHVPPDSDILNSTEATKNIKRIVTLLTGSE
ncbi:hypothetical protein EDD86DRAFT_194277 [Gorgonomyces haynaldii]|nr:hypothetical protein EDD86DRAFT_194277 [Gorgonomyces haynaldii]